MANPGTDWWSGKSLTLGDVRDHIQQQAWQQAADGSYSDFVMTSAADATVTLNFNPENDPAKATVSVERMAARLDYQPVAAILVGTLNIPAIRLKLRVPRWSTT